MHKLSAVAALAAALQSADAAHLLFVCPPYEPSAADAGDRGAVIRVMNGGGMGSEGGGMRFEGGGMTDGGTGAMSGGGMGGMGRGGWDGMIGGLGGLFGFHQPDCPEPHRKSLNRHPQSKLSSCSN